MIPLSCSKTFRESFNIALDIDLTLLDTLTPWLNVYGATIDQLNPNDESIWEDLSGWLETNFAPHPKYKKPYEFWNDPEVYHTAKMFEGTIEFLKKFSDHVSYLTNSNVNYFYVSTCTAKHKDAKVKRVNDLLGEIVKGGFIDTKCKHLADFDLIFDDSPHQCISISKAGKRAFLMPAPMNNIEAIKEQEKLFYGTPIAYHPNEVKYGEFFSWFVNNDNDVQREIVRAIISSNKN